MFVVGVVVIGVDALTCALAYCAESLFTTTAHLVHDMRNILIISEIAFKIGCCEEQRLFAYCKKLACQRRGSEWSVDRVGNSCAEAFCFVNDISLQCVAAVFQICSQSFRSFILSNLGRKNRLAYLHDYLLVTLVKKLFYKTQCR